MHVPLIDGMEANPGMELAIVVDMADDRHMPLAAPPPPFALRAEGEGSTKLVLLRGPEGHQ
jgi:hypothetical protein